MNSSKFFLSTLIAAAAMTVPAYATTSSFIVGTSSQATIFSPDEAVQVIATGQLSEPGGSVGSLIDGTSIAFELSPGKTGTWTQNTSWSNSSALTDLNSALGIDVTAGEVASLTSFGGWGNGAVTTLNLDFSNNTTTVSKYGYEIVLYSFVSTWSSGVSSGNVSVSGLADGATLEFATASGDGFASYDTSTSLASGDGLALVKVTGTLDDLSSVVGLKTTGGKNAFSLTGYSLSAIEAAVWAGTQENYTWDSTGSNFTGGNPAKVTAFDGAGNSAVEISGAVSSNVVDITAAHTFTVVNADSSLTMGTVAVDAGAGNTVSFVDNSESMGIYATTMDVSSGNVSFSGSGDAMVGTLNLAGGNATISNTPGASVTTLNATADATLTLSGTSIVAYVGTLNVESGKTLTLSGGVVTVSGGNLAGTVSISDDSSLVLGGDVVLSAAIANSGTLTFSDGVRIDVSGLSKVGNDYCLAYGAGQFGGESLTGENFVGGSYRSEVYFNDADGMLLYNPGANITDLVWIGGNGTWDTTSTNWNSATGGNGIAFVNGDSVTFNSDATVAVSSDITADTVTIVGGTVSFTGNKLTATTGFNVTGGTLKATGDYLSGAVTVGSGAAFDVNGVGDLSQNGLGTVTLNGGTLQNTGADVGNGSQQIWNLVLTADSKINAASSFGLIGKGYAATSLDLGDNNTLTKTGADVFFLYSTTISGTGTISIAEGSISNGNTAFTIKEGANVTIENNSTTASTIGGTLTANGDSTWSGSGSTTINALTSGVGGKTLTLGEGTKLSVISYAASSNKSLNFDLGKNSVLNIGSTDLQGVSNGDARTITGTLDERGAISSVVNIGTFASKLDHVIEFSDVRVNIGDGGICRTSGASWAPGTQRLTNAILGTTTATAWTVTTDVPLAFGGTVTVDTAVWDKENNTATETAGSITIASPILDSDTAGSGSLVKIGAGTLILSGDNKYTGGTTIEDGVLVAQHKNALGSGSVKLDGGQLNVDGVTLSNTSITVVLGDAYDADLDSAVAAIVGTTGAFSNETKILLDWATPDADQRALKMLTSTTEKQYKILGESLVSASVTFELSDTLKEQGWDGCTYDRQTGWITLVPVPEPSAFGLLAGVGALALVASRRRRSR